MLFWSVRVGLSRRLGGGCGSPLRPRPQTAPGSGGKGRGKRGAGSAGPGRQENRAERRNSTQEGARAEAAGALSVASKKPGEEREGRVRLRACPSEPLLALLRAGSPRSRPGPCARSWGRRGAAGKSPYSSAGVVILRINKITIKTNHP